MDHIDPRYRPPVPEGYVHWDNVVKESPGATLSDRVAMIQAQGIPVEDILIDEFVPRDGYNKPMTAIFVRDRHVGIARSRVMEIEMRLKRLRDLEGEQ